MSKGSTTGMMPEPFVTVMEAQAGEGTLTWFRKWLAAYRGVPLESITAETAITPGEVSSGGIALTLSRGSMVVLSRVGEITTAEKFVAVVDKQ